MTELIVGTRKGLFVLEGEPGEPFEVATRAFPGETVDYALRDTRSGRSTARRSGIRPTPRGTGSRRRASRCQRAATRRSSGSG